MLGIARPDDRPLDGISLDGALGGSPEPRPDPIGFWHRNLFAWVGERYKLLSVDGGRTFALYDALEDPGEQRDLAVAQPERVETMKHELQVWRTSCEESARGMDY